MKNATKIPAAQELLVHAKSLGFTYARLHFQDDNSDVYDSLDEIADHYETGSELSITIHLILDDELEFTVVEDGEDVAIEYAE